MSSPPGGAGGAGGSVGTLAARAAVVAGPNARIDLVILVILRIR